jgi:leucyl-tRNA synthetase
MNGLLHIGHGFTMIKVDTQIKFQMLLGKNVLFPFGFHCTGMPIKAAADNLKEELEKGVNDLTSRRKPPYQYHILRDMGIPSSEIPEFVNYQKWFHYFPEKAIEDLQNMGLSVDWRRSFITTESNPYYDLFVKWYMNVLKKRGYIKYDKQAVVWSPKDKQVCSDHARKVGEGVKPKRHSMIKTTLENTLFMSFGQRTYLLALIEDPNNLEFQTKFLINSKGKYSIYKLSNDFVICTEKCAKELTYQGFTEIEKVYSFIPAKQLSQNKARNIVTNKWLPIELDDNVKCTCKCFVEDVKHPVTPIPELSEMIMNYYTLDSPVITRSGDRCIVALMDQWFFDFSNENWKKLVKEHIKTMDTSENIKNELERAVDQMQDKSFGRDSNQSIGSRIPWEEESSIDSLSDSTVYMMYYTIAHYLHSDLYGQIQSKLPLDCWTDKVMDYIFLGKKEPNTEFKTVIKKMRDEFMYWYPLDLRVSGKDLVRNHLPFSLFHHVALFGTELSPRDFRINGYIMINHEKMSKSQGNFITLAQAFEQFTVDATRFTLADSGDDPIADANFNTGTAISIKDKLSKKLEWTISFVSSGKKTTNNHTLDEYFKHRLQMCLKKTKEAYTKRRLKDVCFYGFYELETYRKQYFFFANDNINYDLIMRYIKEQALVLYPLIPYFCKKVFDLIGTKELTFPIYDWNSRITEEADFYNSIWDSINLLLKPFRKTKKPIGKITITFVKDFPNWVYQIESILKKADLNDQRGVMKQVGIKLQNLPIDKKRKKSVMMSVKKAVQTQNLEEFSTNKHIRLDNAENMMKILSKKLEIPINFFVVSKDPQIIPSKPKIDII